MRIIRVGAILGAAIGSGVAVLMISLVYLRPFSVPVNVFVERATFKLCPLFILGFTSVVGSTTSLCIVTVAGNALLYGAVFGAVAAVFSLGVTLFRRYATQAP